MLVKVFGAAVQGIHATLITIEVNVGRGIKFMLVGLPDASVKESHERIVSAIEVNGYKFPRQQVVVNMSPADIRKEGSAYDLPLAIGVGSFGRHSIRQIQRLPHHGRAVARRYHLADKRCFAYRCHGKGKRL